MAGLRGSARATGSRERSVGRGRHRVPRHNRAVRLGFLGLGIVLLIAGVLADACYQAYRIYRDLKGPLADVAVVRTSLANGTVPPREAVDAIRRATARAQGQVDGARLTFRLAGAVPFVGRPVVAVRRGVAAAEEGGQAATLMVDMLRDILGDDGSAASVSSSSKASRPLIHNGGVDLDLIEGLEPRLQIVLRHLRAGERDIRAIPRIPFVPQLDRLKAKALDQSAEAITLAERTSLGMRLLPSFLGAHGTKTYLLAMQNNAEVRATGGALLAYGFVQASDGKLKLTRAGSTLDIGDRGVVSGVRLPPSLEWYAHLKQRDRPRLAGFNRSPDFPLVARAWASIIRKATGQRIDGAIALDPIAISYVLGERRIRVPSYPSAITATNVVKVIESDQYRLPPLQQLLLTGELIRAAWPILSNPHPILPTARQLGAALREKHLQIWSADQEDQVLLGRLGWDGALRVNPGDYLLAVNNQARWNKLDYFVHTKILCDVTVGASGQSHSTCEVRLTNRTPPGQPPIVLGRKRSRVSTSAISLYVPRRAALEAEEPGGGRRPHMEGQALVFYRIIQSLPGRDGVARFTYSVPRVVRSTAAGKVYQLTIQHQPLVNPAEVAIRVTLPHGTTIRSAPGWHVEGNVATFQAVLTRDVVLQIAF